MATDNRTKYQLQFGTRIDQMLQTEYDPTFDDKDLRYYSRIMGSGTTFYAETFHNTIDSAGPDTNSEHRRKYRANYDVSWRGNDPSSGGTSDTDNNWYLFASSSDPGGAWFILYNWDDGVNDPAHSDYYFFCYPGGTGTPYVRIKGAAFVLDSEMGATAQAGASVLGWNDTRKGLDTKDNGGTTYALGYTDRGDPSSYDYDETDLTADGAWHDLNLSSIVPAGAKAVVLYMEMEGTTKGASLKFRKNGNTNAIVHCGASIPIANSETHNCVLVACDSNRVIEYERSSSGITSIDLVVNGWYI